MAQIRWSKKAFKQLMKIDTVFRTRIYKAVDELVDFPSCQNIKSLTNHTYGYRLRAGNYRVFFNYEGSVDIAYIEEVRKRDERTY
jgi:mRNA-degrading endonuclease RelE of RelBE toxin-antitoxin system